MKGISPSRLLVVIISFALGILIEYLWLGSDAFQAVGLILLAVFVGPIFLLLIWLEQKFSHRTKK